MTDPMPREQIEAALERAEKATEGPWRCSAWGPHNSECGKAQPAQIVGPKRTGHMDRELSVVDATFIAHARTDVPALARDLLAARERIEQLENTFAAKERAQQQVEAECADLWRVVEAARRAYELPPCDSCDVGVESADCACWDISDAHDEVCAALAELDREAPCPGT